MGSILMAMAAAVAAVAATLQRSAFLLIFHHAADHQGYHAQDDRSHQNCSHHFLLNPEPRIRFLLHHSYCLYYLYYLYYSYRSYCLIRACVSIHLLLTRRFTAALLLSGARHALYIHLQGRALVVWTQQQIHESDHQKERYQRENAEAAAG